MSWVGVLKITTWLGEVTLIVFTLVLLLKMILGNVSKINDLTDTLYSYINRSQRMTEHLDHEFCVMKKCLEEVKLFTKGYTVFYKTMAESRNSVNHALCLNKFASIPIGLNLSKLLVPVRMDSIVELEGLPADADPGRTGRSGHEFQASPTGCDDGKEKEKIPEDSSIETVLVKLTEESVVKFEEKAPHHFDNEKLSMQSQNLDIIDSSLTHTL